jgi:hypothetical protein
MRHLERYEAQLRRKGGDNAWYELQASPHAHLDDFAKPKIMYSEIVQYPQVYFDEKGEFYSNNTIYIIVGDHLPFLCAALHSKAAAYAFKHFYAGGGLGENGYRYLKAFLETLPIPIPSLEIERSIVSLFRKRVKENDTIKQRAIEREIDALVYRLYRLTKKEIALIESK